MTAVFPIVLLMQKTMRLDVYLCEIGLAASRNEAQGFIKSGAVKVDGKIVLKPAFAVDGKPATIEVDHSAKKYVSRGGYKLEGALNAFSVSVTGKYCIDVGASSGGFTDCLLQHGAAHVVAIDSGTAQLASALVNDNRVTSIENYNARFLNANDIPYYPDLAVMDVSFISATYIIPAIFNCLLDGGEFICLIKPQFEVGKEGIGKGGIVKDAKARDAAVTKVVDFAKATGFSFLGATVSSIKGGDGNIEFLAYFKKINGAG